MAKLLIDQNDDDGQRKVHRRTRLGPVVIDVSVQHVSQQRIQLGCMVLRIFDLTMKANPSMEGIVEATCDCHNAVLKDIIGAVQGTGQRRRIMHIGKTNADDDDGAVRKILQHKGAKKN